MAKIKKASNAKPGPKRRRTTFRLNAPSAGQVNLAGDFNGWDGRRHPMRKK